MYGFKAVDHIPSECGMLNIYDFNRVGREGPILLYGMHAGMSFTPQSHDDRGHKLRIIHGTGLYHIGDEIFEYCPGMKLDVFPGQRHAFVCVYTDTIVEQENT